MGLLLTIRKRVWACMGQLRLEIGLAGRYDREDDIIIISKAVLDSASSVEM